MSFFTAWARAVSALFGGAGRLCFGAAKRLLLFLSHTSGVWHLFVSTLYYSTVGPFRETIKLRQQLFIMMSKVGVQSFPIVALISFLMGAILGPLGLILALVIPKNVP